MANGIKFDVDGPVARITLNRDDVGNAIDVAMARALMEVSIVCDENDAIRSVLLTGSGRLFCAGGDIAAFSSARSDMSALIKEITGYLHLAIARFARMNKPLVTAVNGTAAGAGVGLALLGDVSLVSPDAHFVIAYSNVGLSPDAGLTWLLPRLVGLRKAQELLFTSKRIKADEAARLGLVTRVVAADTLLKEATNIARELSFSATTALGAVKQLLIDSFTHTLETQMEIESRFIAAQARTPDGQEGVRAFIEKRAPNFAKESSI